MLQFGPREGRELLPAREDLAVSVSGEGRIKHVMYGGAVYLTLRPVDGLFSLAIPAALRLLEASSPPRHRVVVRGLGPGDIRGSVLAPAVVRVDPRLRPGDEVLIVDEGDELLGVGRLRVPPAMVEGLIRGEVVRVRRKAGGGSGGGGPGGKRLRA